jgi:hypothetical protein
MRSWWKVNVSNETDPSFDDPRRTRIGLLAPSVALVRATLTFAPPAATIEQQFTGR